MSNAVVTTGILVRRGSGVAGTAKTVSAASTAPTGAVVTTTTAHGLYTGQSATITLTGSTPAVTGQVFSVTVLSPTTFSISQVLTVAGTGGTATATETLDTIGEIVSVSPPGFSRNKLESTTHNDGTESKVLGMLRQKDPTFRINYVGGDVTHQNIIADLFGNVKKNWQIALPSGVSFLGPARIDKFELADTPPDAIQQADCGLTWAGPVVFTAQ